MSTYLSLQEWEDQLTQLDPEDFPEPVDLIAMARKEVVDKLKSSARAYQATGEESTYLALWQEAAQLEGGEGNA